MNKLSMCCNADMIYCGKGKSPIMIFVGAYIYCCSKCGRIEWSTAKEKCKYKWYNYDTNKLKELLGWEGNNDSKRDV